MNHEIEEKLNQLDQMTCPEDTWLAERLGKFTSSKIDTLLTEPKTKEAKAAGELSVGAKTYVRSKAAEIITGVTRSCTSYAIEWGNLYEPEAAEQLQKVYPGMVYMGKQNPKFFKFNSSSGGSPDGVDYNERIIFELKCPEDAANHVEYCMLESAADFKECERGYYYQIQMNMLSVSKELGVSFFDITGIFATYHPLVKDPYPKFKMLVIYPDKDFYDKIIPAISKATQELDNILSRLLKPDHKNSSDLVVNYDRVSGVTLVESFDVNNIPLIKLNKKS